jgi:putative effector of murein hydrolase
MGSRHNVHHFRPYTLHCKVRHCIIAARAIDSYAKETAMALIARILGVSVLTAAFGVYLAHVFFSAYWDQVIASLVLGCTGGIIGAVAGGTREIVARQVASHRSQPPADSNRPDQSLRG